MGRDFGALLEPPSTLVQGDENRGLREKNIKDRNMWAKLSNSLGGEKLGDEQIL